MKINFINLMLIGFFSMMICSTAFGQVTNSITIKTDKTSYNDGEQMTISGKVSSQLNVPISIVIKDPSNNIVMIGQVSPNADNTYSTHVTTGGRLWKSPGTYEIDVTYGTKENTSKTTFEFVGNAGGTGNMTGSSGANQAIPEFGPMHFVVLALSMIILTAYMRIRTGFKIR